ncbi:MAG: spore protease YyaC [Clostridia bacterium]|nr:spore protease YyaC [Clostridia bacterium]
MHIVNTANSGYKYNIMSAVYNMIEYDNLLPIILCIGSPDVAGDSLGPLTGHLLTHKYNIRTFVYGTIGRPVYCSNVIDVYRFIREKHCAKILAVDAALGYQLNTINIFKGGIRPAAALNKNLPLIGDYSITANVSYCANNNYVSLRWADKKSIAAMADNIAFAISDAVMLRKIIFAQKAV